MIVAVHPQAAVAAVHGDLLAVEAKINAFTARTFRTRGGRLGSGMGSLIEALWVYFMNEALANEGGEARVCELAWLEDHEPADFACLHREAEWTPQSRGGELFRIEAKSMNATVDEPKGHFTNLVAETREHDQLLVLVWSWADYDHHYRWPRIDGSFIEPALPLIRLRDRLHLARGGSFVAAGECPDGCAANNCTHLGEPLNAKAKRERPTGPKATKPANVSHAANFGGLARIIKTSSPAATAAFREERAACDVCHAFISFLHGHFPNEELGQYKLADWRALAKQLGIPTKGKSASALRTSIQVVNQKYRDSLRALG